MKVVLIMECENIKDKPSYKNVKERIYGLTEEEVEERVKKGEVNTIPNAPSRTLPQILRANFFNLFNGLNIVLALICIIAGSPKNAIFAGVIIVNSIIGVIQELNAKKTLEKLSVLSMAHTNVLREGKIKDILVEELVKDDVVYLTAGCQVLADCALIEGDELEVDESMLTGEADPVNKNNDDEILSGSFIVAGEGYARVKKVGINTYSSQLANEAKKFKIINSELQNSINKIMKILVWLILPLGVGLTITQILSNTGNWQDGVIGVVSGIIGMIPEGLVLLTSATFIVSIVKLAQYDTLVQQLSATEILARVDVLCVDKTGTITEGKLKLSEVKLLGDYNKEKVDEILASIANNLPSKNPTQQAILDVYSKDPGLVVKEKIPFSSRRKWAGIVLKNLGSWAMGAPEILLGDKYSEIANEVEEYAKQGMRVLLLVKVNQETLKFGIKTPVETIALILIEDIIKEEAPSVIQFFNDEDVNLKVISGDNPVTVAAVAKRAGIKNSEKYVDARTLPTKMKELSKVIDNYTVFGRVTPHQKKDIVKALRKNGHTVAMTGDGVNDVLALKESDCGIAMANGSEATKAVAQLVLLNSDFGSLPKVVAEGRKQIHNLETVAELFLSKTIFFVCLALMISIIRLPYPLLPIQSSLVGSCAIGIPALFLALLPAKQRVEKGFLKRILISSVPNGIIMMALVLLGYIITYMSGASVEYSRSVALLTFMGISLIILVRVSAPLTKFKFTLVCTMISFCAACYVIPIGRNLFSLVKISFKHWMLVLTLILIAGILIFARGLITKKYYNNKKEKLKK